MAREGDAYRLDVASDGVDVGRFDRAMAEGRSARSRGEVASAAYALALELYGGELLPEEGPAEWIVSRRDHYREAAVEAAGELASESMLAGDFGTAVRACRFGLEIDRYQDSLWRMLIEARTGPATPGRRAGTGASTRRSSRARRGRVSIGLHGPRRARLTRRRAGLVRSAHCARDVPFAAADRRRSR